MALPIETTTARALRHVVAQSRGRRLLYPDGNARAGAARQLADGCRRHRLRCLVWCVTDRCLHVVLAGTPGSITLATNELVGHRLQQSHWLSSTVQRDVYLLELARHALLAPVRARLCRQPADWPWSSARECFGMRPVSHWLDPDPLYDLLGANNDTGPIRMRRFMESR
ncbi:MAG: hypothetical protein ACT4UQ_11085 [Gammaproteobacteria bacterium]